MNLMRPFISVPHSTLGILAVCCTVIAILLCLSTDPVPAQNALEEEPDINLLMQGKAYVYKLDPEGSTGKGYKLVYMVAAPLGAYWKFKTDKEIKK
jgi:hypothetical protein